MEIINKKYLFIERKDNIPKNVDIEILKIDNAPSMVIQKITKTRIRTNNDSVYVNSPSREIKKWFVTRRI